MCAVDPAGATPARFGTVLGVAPGGVAVYSSHYPSADPAELPDRRAYRHHLDGLYMGYKWQCVELARRFLYLNFGHVFADVGMAYEIFRLRHVRRVRDGRLLPLVSFRNGSRRRPEPGCLLVWDEGGDFDATGHVAVVTEVADDRIRFVEQNVDNCLWPAGRTWSRELPAQQDADGGYHVRCSGAGTSILGWVIQTLDDRHAEPPAAPDPRLLVLRCERVPDHGQAGRPWLDLSRPEEAAYLAASGGHRLASRDDDQHLFFVLPETAARELRHATNELHAMFLHATGQVLDDDGMLARFNIPRSLWPRLRWSWNNRRHQLVTGRFDFALSEWGLKLYEYNADSAACHLECGRLQGRWAAHFGCHRGRDAGADLFERLVSAWRGVPISGPIHLMLDRDPEERYHTLFMRSALEAAGWQCRILDGLTGLGWDRDGRVVDPDGVVVQRVWKTWAWETALEQLRAGIEGPSAAPSPGRGPGRPPRLVDVLLHPEVVVHEPLWTLIPSNKAILPVLWQLFPDHPYLLNSRYEPDAALRATGWVAKPIAGRAGANVRMVAPGERLLAETDGRYQDQDQVYQELFPLPVVDGRHVQVSTFPVDGRYAGCCVRVDPTPVITASSDVLPLRIVEDGR